MGVAGFCLWSLSKGARKCFSLHVLILSEEGNTDPLAGRSGDAVDGVLQVDQELGI